MTDFFFKQIYSKMISEEKSKIDAAKKVEKESK